jgi:hypothetical protein
VQMIEIEKIPPPTACSCAVSEWRWEGRRAVLLGADSVVALGSGPTCCTTAEPVPYLVGRTIWLRPLVLVRGSHAMMIDAVVAVDCRPHFTL